MLLSLVLFVCNVNTDKCYKDTVDWAYSFQECQLYGQMYFSDVYQPMHPNRVLRKYKCVVEPMGDAV